MLIKMEIKKNTLYLVMIISILMLGGFFFLKSGNSVTNDVISSDGQILDGKTQQVVISEKNLNYYPDTIKVKAGQPLSISLDDSVRGCLRNLVIKDLGVSKYARTPEDTIDFTPTKKGTFTFSCSMGMGYGKLIVE